MTAPAGFHLIPSHVDADVPLRDQEVHLVLPNHAHAEHRYDLEAIQAFQSAADYLAVAQIYLLDNVLLHTGLDCEAHVKKRLLGHFGTVPGLVFAYAHATALLARTEKKATAAGDEYQPRGIFVTGPGHGAPAVLACLYLEGSISKFSPDEALSAAGVQRFVKNFCWPNSMRPSHVTATTPGSIHEGGELGYALGVAYGAVMDKRDLIAFAVIGDGEAETGPTATAWHAHKFIDPAESGAVLPILHLNRFKISEKTIFGAMDRSELLALFTGYGYQVRFVDYYQHLGGRHTRPGEREVAAFDVDMATSLDWAYDEIRKIQRAARNAEPVHKPRWPMIILSSPKGWGGPQTVDGLQVEASFRSHQVPLHVDAHSPPDRIKKLEDWLRSYQPQMWFALAGEGADRLEISSLVTRMLPSESLRMGQLRELTQRSPDLVDVGTGGFMVDSETSAADKKVQVSAMQQCGAYLAALIPLNPDRLLIFSPDELVSNKLDAALSLAGFKGRKFEHAFESQVTGTERRQGMRSGRVIEMLSEHTLQAFAQGYALTGRISVFPSYEAFLGIVTTMISQFAKFVKEARATGWRPPVPSITYLETSTLWRQESNGFSHQSPGLINAVLDLPHNVARVYLPPDANCALSTLSHCVRSRNYVNLVVGSKHPNRVFLGADEANRHCKAGASIWHAYSNDKLGNPDVVIVGIGTETTAEAIAATELLKGLGGKESIRARFVNVTDLMVLSERSVHPHALDAWSFQALFTTEAPVLFNFHGYPTAVKGLLGDRLSDVWGRRPTAVLGYREQGTTTTPFSMLMLNGVDRFTVALTALDLLIHKHDLKEDWRRVDARLLRMVVSDEFVELQTSLQETRQKWQTYIDEHGCDPPELDV